MSDQNTLVDCCFLYPDCERCIMFLDDCYVEPWNKRADIKRKEEAMSREQGWYFVSHDIETVTTYTCRHCGNGMRVIKDFSKEKSGTFNGVVVCPHCHNKTEILLQVSAVIEGPTPQKAKKYKKIRNKAEYVQGNFKECNKRNQMINYLKDMRYKLFIGKNGIDPVREVRKFKRLLLAARQEINQNTIVGKPCVDERGW